MTHKNLKLDKEYWDNRYLNQDFGWDLGEISPPLQKYFETLKDHNLKILIPGAGNSYEAEYLHKLGFKNVFVCDLAPSAIENLKQRCPDFPEKHLILGDFFALKENDFDLIVEQTFFCAIDPRLRRKYAETVYHLLQKGGKLAGLLFNDVLNTDQPPFGGNADEYLPLFRDLFEPLHFESCYNSIAPRAGRELFIELQKKE